MRKTTGNTERSLSDLLPELIARIFVVGFCGTLCFVGFAESLRAIENENLTLGDSGLPTGALIAGLFAAQSLLRLRSMLVQFFRGIFAKQILWCQSTQSLPNVILARPPSKIGGMPVTVMICLTIGVVFTISNAAKVRGEATVSILQVGAAAAVSLLPLFGAVFYGIATGEFVLPSSAPGQLPYCCSGALWPFCSRLIN